MSNKCNGQAIARDFIHILMDVEEEAPQGYIREHQANECNGFFSLYVLK